MTAEPRRVDVRPRAWTRRAPTQETRLLVFTLQSRGARVELHADGGVLITPERLVTPSEQRALRSVIGEVRTLLCERPA